jgi:hypothetical protein
MSLSQDGESSDYVPRIGMNFETDEEAYKFYNDYALIVGFSTVKSGTYTSRNKKTIGEVTRRIHKYNRCGAIDHKDAATDAQKKAPAVEFGADGKLTGLQIIADDVEPVHVVKKKRNKVIDKTNCLAEMTVTKKHGIWTINRLLLEHNHKLLTPSMAKLLRSHRYFSE